MIQKKRYLFIMVMVFSSSFTISQTVKKDWEYGFNANFNIPFIKPVVSDSLTNKPGLGAGLFLEASKGKWSLQAAPSYAFTRYIHDKTLATTEISSLDFAIDVNYTPLPASAVYFTGGIVPSYTFSKVEQRLNGSQSNGVSTIPEENPVRFDWAYKFGVALELSQGTRITINYYEFNKGEQKNGKINGRADYFQFGLQVRVRDLMDSDRSSLKREKLANALAVANRQLREINNGATMIFVIPDLEGLSKSPSKTSELIALDRDTLQRNIVEAIQNYYNIGPYRILSEEAFKNFIMGGSAIGTDGNGDSIQTTLDSGMYIAKIGNHSLADNSKLSWGIAVHNVEMELLKEPFPMFIPYRNIDAYFRSKPSVEKMIQEFNSTLRGDDQ